MREGIVRAIAICVFRNQDRILVAKGYDPVKQQLFYRPLGGSIEFGERSADTIIREMQEELGASVTHLRYLGTLENIFNFAGQKGHEIVLVYDGDFVDATLYQKKELAGVEDDGSPFQAVWLQLTDCREAAAAPLYPTGLLALLTDHTESFQN